MTLSLVLFAAGFLIATVAAPAYDQWRRSSRARRDAEFARRHRAVVDAPRFDRPRRVDPSPRRRAS